jgi:D-glycero-D-manno-heptose 1,7-bisphosphate phosphatase
MGWLVIVVTNQRCVDLGLMTAAELDSMHRRMREELAARGARIDDVFACTHGEGECECRKPRSGMVVEAAGKWDIDIRRSILVGDGERDRELAARCGMGFVLVDEGRVVETYPMLL